MNPEGLAGKITEGGEVKESRGQYRDGDCVTKSSLRSGEEEAASGAGTSVNMQGPQQGAVMGAEDHVNFTKTGIFKI